MQRRVNTAEDAVKELQHGKQKTTKKKMQTENKASPHIAKAAVQR